MEIPVENTADAYLELLASRGVKYFFANAGTDFAPLVEGFTKRKAENITFPIPVLCPHEATAVSMAHGYYMVTGEPQVVMVHVNVGTANAAAQVMNATKARIPLLFTAGRTPINEEGPLGHRSVYIHWAQESRDQAAMLREYVKWDYELRNSAQLETVVDRALTLSMADPPGPVYLILPREVLAEEKQNFLLEQPKVQIAETSTQPDKKAIESAAKLLSKAKSPLIIAGAAGIDPEAVHNLIKLAETGAIPVIEHRNIYMNFPTDHPLHLGFEPRVLLEEADVVVVLETDVPWIPTHGKPPKDASVIHLGCDPYFSDYPIRSFPMDVVLKGKPAIGLQLLSDALEQSLKGKGSELTKRKDRYARIHKQQREEWKQLATEASKEKPIDYRWVSHCINEVSCEDTILINEYDLLLEHVDFKRPGTFYGSSHASGLGWGLGASLGVKLAKPEKTIITCVGDGSYMFNSPTSAHFVSRAQNLPTLTIVFNNQCWNAVRRSAESLYPDGWASGRNQFPLSDLEPSPNFEKMMEVHEGYGERVEDPKILPDALQRALKAVREEGRQALLNVICKHPSS